MGGRRPKKKKIKKKKKKKVYVFCELCFSSAFILLVPLIIAPGTLSYQGIITVHWCNLLRFTVVCSVLHILVPDC